MNRIVLKGLLKDGIYDSSNPAKQVHNAYSRRNWNDKEQDFGYSARLLFSTKDFAGGVHIIQLDNHRRIFVFQIFIRILLTGNLISIGGVIP